MIESPWTVMFFFGSGDGAGPSATDPSRLYLLPWQSQLIVPSATVATMQP